MSKVTMQMFRRDFGKCSFGAMASAVMISRMESPSAIPHSDFPKINGLTDYVAKFISTTKYEDIPAEVVELGKKSILDGLGLALAGSKAATGTICRKYLQTLG